MRTDASAPSKLLDHSTDRNIQSVGFKGSVALVMKGVVLLVLVSGTSWVITNWLSLWLVPPYWLVIAVILVPPPMRHRAGLPTDGHPGQAKSELSALPPVHPEGIPKTENLPCPPPSATNRENLNSVKASDSIESAKGPSAKRGRGRPRKVAKSVGDSIPMVEATWIEVGPGKFVRADPPGDSIGPDDLAVPAEARLDLPSSSEEQFDASFVGESARDDVDPEGVATGVAGTWEPTPQICGEGQESSESEPQELPTTDGITLQGDGSGESGSWPRCESSGAVAIASGGSDQISIRPEDNSPLHAIFDQQPEVKLNLSGNRLPQRRGRRERRTALSRGRSQIRHGRSHRTKNRRRGAGRRPSDRGGGLVTPRSSPHRGGIDRR